MGGWRRSKIHILILQSLSVTTCSPEPHSRLESVKTWGLVVSLASRGYTIGQQVANAQTCLRRTASIGVKEPPRMSMNSFRRSGSAITSVCGAQIKRSATAILAGVQRGSGTFQFFKLPSPGGGSICHLQGYDAQENLRDTLGSSEHHCRSSLFFFVITFISRRHASSSPAISMMGHSLIIDHASCAEQCLTKSQVPSPQPSP